MLELALLFLVITVVAGIFGFGVFSGVAAAFAQILFFVFCVLFIAALIFSRNPIDIV